MSTTRRSNTPETSRQQRMVVVDYQSVSAWRMSRGISDTDFCKQCGLGKATYYRMKRGEPVELSTARRIAEAMGVSDVREILDGADVAVFKVKSGDPPLAVDEWEITRPLCDWAKASNGLQYRVFQMHNRFSPDQWARGKCYELDGVYAQDRERVDACFTRHADVCRRVGPEPHVAACYRSSPDPTGRFWWVIDHWPSGRMLAEQLTGQPLEFRQIKSLLSGVARGLQSLHAVDVVRRELAPRNIAWDAATGQVVLTDFELGKLLDGSITVSKGPWPVDPYRAPEVGKGRATKAADFFSWGRLFVELATGALPPNGQEEIAIKRVLLPRDLREFVLACVDVVPANRRTAFEPALKMLSNWV